MPGRSIQSAPPPGLVLSSHRGAIDKTMITTEPPRVFMARVRNAILTMGVHALTESEFKYRCIRPKRATEIPLSLLEFSQMDQSRATLESTTTVRPLPPDRNSASESSTSDAEPMFDSETPYDTVYGERPEDVGDEVRFSVELTTLEGLPGTYSLDIRRLKGNLRSYRFLYNTLRQRINPQMVT